MIRQPRPIPNSYWVTPERLLAGEYPGASDATKAREKLHAFLDAGIRSFVDLTEAHELTAYDGLLSEIAAAREVDVRYRRMSVEDLGIPTMTHMSEVLRHIDSEIREGRAVYVHCWGGIGRTGTVVGCWIVQSEHRTAEEALQRITELRRTVPERRASPETDEQRTFVERWPPARDRRGRG
jgi:protein-tyrosine phosphatase